MALVVSRRIAPLFLNPAARPVCLTPRDSEPPMNDKNDEARDRRWLLLLALFWLAAAIWLVSQKWAAIKGLAIPETDDNLCLQQEMGSASCRDRVYQYVSISVVAVSLQKKTNNR